MTALRRSRSEVNVSNLNSNSCLCANCRSLFLLPPDDPRSKHRQTGSDGTRALRIGTWVGGTRSLEISAWHSHSGPKTWCQLSTQSGHCNPAEVFRASMLECQSEDWGEKSVKILQRGLGTQCLRPEAGALGLASHHGSQVRHHHWERAVTYEGAYRGSFVIIPIRSYRTPQQRIGRGAYQHNVWVTFHDSVKPKFVRCGLKFCNYTVELTHASALEYRQTETCERMANGLLQTAHWLCSTPLPPHNATIETHRGIPSRHFAKNSTCGRKGTSFRITALNIKPLMRDETNDHTPDRQYRSLQKRTLN